MGIGLVELGVSAPPSPRKRLRRGLSIGVAVAAICLLAVVSILHFTPRPSSQIFAIHYLSSKNWAGYATAGVTPGNVTSVTATWTQPRDADPCIAGFNEYSSFWVGVDGAYSSTIEQVGTELDCRNGSVNGFAWYQYYPAALVNLSSFSVFPGDEISASVTYVSPHFTLQLDDRTRGTSFQNISADLSAPRSSAECIAEDPFAGAFYLTDFGVISFQSCSATIDGKSGVLNKFPAIQGLNMTNLNGSILRADISPLDETTGGFSVAWQSGAA